MENTEIQAVVEPEVPAEMLAVVVDMNGAELTVETFDKTGRSLPWLENLAGADAAAILVDDELGDFPASGR
ncbi:MULTISPECIES: hypothetical protein [unclassified Mesorhizobium]|uniref:hypothetical protein n=1 Tax=unclassified Mesorhizobium TaxID=325217 RepID=UPI001FE1684C|nr:MULTISPECIES: hypothetical protein [unclassified Mesorhizobium]